MLLPKNPQLLIQDLSQHAVNHRTNFRCLNMQWYASFVSWHDHFEWDKQLQRTVQLFLDREAFHTLENWDNMENPLEDVQWWADFTFTFHTVICKAQWNLVAGLLQQWKSSWTCLQKVSGSFAVFISLLKAFLQCLISALLKSWPGFGLFADNLIIFSLRVSFVYHLICTLEFDSCYSYKFTTISLGRQTFDIRLHILLKILWSSFNWFVYFVYPEYQASIKALKHDRLSTILCRGHVKYNIFQLFWQKTLFSIFTYLSSQSQQLLTNTYFTI